MRVLWYYEMMDLLLEKLPDIARVLHYEEMVAIACRPQVVGIGIPLTVLAQENSSENVLKVALHENETHVRKRGSDAGGVMDADRMRIGEYLCRSGAPRQFLEVELAALRIELCRKSFEESVSEESRRLERSSNCVIDDRILIATLDPGERRCELLHRGLARA